MDTQYIGASLFGEAFCVSGLAGAGEAFVGDAYQYGAAEVPEGIDVLEKLPVLLYGLGEAEAGVEYPVVDPEAGGALPETAEVVIDGFNYAFRVFREAVHRAGIAAFVHGYVWKPEARDGLQHLWVVFPGRNVIHDEWSHPVINPPYYLCASGIDRAGRYTL